MRRSLTVPTAILAAFLIAGCTSSDTAASEETTVVTEAPTTTAATGATVVAAVTTTAPSGADESKTEGPLPEVEEEITALIDAWMAAWNEGDGQAAVDLFADDGRYVSDYTAPGSQPLDGLSGEDLKERIEGEAGYDATRTGSPVIIVRDNSNLGRPDSYRVAQRYRAFPYGEEHFELYNIVVDENGELKFRYAEQWSELGWFRLTEESPYQRVGAGE